MYPFLRTTDINSVGTLQCTWDFLELFEFCDFYQISNQNSKKKDEICEWRKRHT